MKVLLAGGGTAGHINPALAIISIIKDHCPDAEFLYIHARQLRCNEMAKLMHGYQTGKNQNGYNCC